MNDVIFSFIMPCLNSEKTIRKTMESIVMQDFPRDKYEILVIDGGSTDHTIDIAKEYGAIILINEGRIPETAKRIGINNAKGKYIILHDSDEEFIGRNQLSKRYEFFVSHSNVYCYVVNRLIPGRNCGIACAYLNIVSDPFSYIVYGNKGSIISTNRRYISKKEDDAYVFSYAQGDITPIGDGGSTTIDLDKAKSIFGDEVYTQDFAVSVFTQMVVNTHLVGCIADDCIVHNSNATMRSFLQKLRFRININLNDVEKSGYSARAGHNLSLRNRKAWFVIYGISVIGPLLDSIRLAFVHRRPSLMLHFFYTYYVCTVALIEVIKNTLHIGGGNYSYGKD